MKKYQANTTIKTIQEYLDMTADCNIMVPNLRFAAPDLIADAKELGLPICGWNPSKTKPPYLSIVDISDKQDYSQVYRITIRTKDGHKILLKDLNNFCSGDLREKNQAELNNIADALNFFGNEGCTMRKNIETLIEPDILAEATTLWPDEQEYYVDIVDAMKGGACAIMPQYLNVDIPHEVHVDVHQMYGYIMSTFDFPVGQPEIHAGFYYSQFAVFALGHSMMRLRKDGYPLFSNQISHKPIGIDGRPFDVQNELGSITSMDLELLYANYELLDNNLKIDYSIVWPNKVSGKKVFKPVVNLLYSQRKKYKGKPGASVFKLANEYIAGIFERSIQGKEKYNPKIGMFITAYGRCLLNDMLHQCRHDLVIGYDTDAVFLACAANEVPTGLQKGFGDDKGQYHVDTDGINAFHFAAKHYKYQDAATGNLVEKEAGKSASGYCWYWNKKTGRFTYDKQAR